MASAAWSATATTSEMIAADASRGSITVQLLTGNPVTVGIDENAVYAGGLTLLALGDHITLTGLQAQKAIDVICDTGNSATGSYQTALPTYGQEP